MNFRLKSFAVRVKRVKTYCVKKNIARKERVLMRNGRKRHQKELG